MKNRNILERMLENVEQFWKWSRSQCIDKHMDEMILLGKNIQEDYLKLCSMENDYLSILDIYNKMVLKRIIQTIVIKMI